MRNLRSWAAIASLAVIAGCQDDGVSARAPDLDTAPPPEGFDQRGEVRTGFVLGRDGQPWEVTYEVIEGRAVFEGDIELGPAGRIARTAEELLAAGREGPQRGPVRDGSSYRWPKGVVPVRISSSLPDKSRVYDAMRHIESYTDVNFVEHSGQSDYVYVVTSSGCSSSVGRQGNVQYLRLDSDCSTGNTIHEFLHAIGIYHEQARCDRGEYVEILWSNIKDGKEGNFDRRCDGATDVSYYSEGSIMHYGRKAFSKNGYPTIRSKRGRDDEMGQRRALSETDIRTVNAIYPPSAPTTIIVDNDNANNNSALARFEASDSWRTYTSDTEKYLNDYRVADGDGPTGDQAFFYFYLEAGGSYRVETRWTDNSNRSPSVTHRVYDASSNRLSTVDFDQRSNGGSWTSLGTHPLTPGWNRVIISRSLSDGGTLSADAVRVTKQ